MSVPDSDSLQQPLSGIPFGSRPRVAIAGSRTYRRAETGPHPGEAEVRAFVDSLPAETVIVTGGAAGPDTWAERAARARGMLVVVYRADWDRYGKRAGFLRNYRVVNEADRIVAFWDGASHGTEHVIKLARKRGKPLEVHMAPDNADAPCLPTRHPRAYG